MAANDQQNMSGLSSTIGPQDMSKLPTYGVSDQSLQDIRAAQQDALDALQKRYENPNWFKIAAGFAKPQLGGFVASLGSASDALGDWVEQQRTQQLPIAEMRAKLAQTNLVLDQNQVVNSAVAKRREAGGNVLDPQFVAEMMSRAPNSPTAIALNDQLKNQIAVQHNAQESIHWYVQNGYTPPDSLIEAAGFSKPTSGDGSGASGNTNPGGDITHPAPAISTDKLVQPKQGEGPSVPEYGSEVAALAKIFRNNPDLYSKDHNYNGSSLFNQALDMEGIKDPKARAFLQGIHVQEGSGSLQGKTTFDGTHYHYGPMQVGDAAFQDTFGDKGDINDPLTNMRAGIRYGMKGYNQANGDVNKAAHYYYAGPTGSTQAEGAHVIPSGSPQGPSPLYPTQEMKEGKTFDRKTAAEQGATWAKKLSEVVGDSAQYTSQYNSLNQLLDHLTPDLKNGQPRSLDYANSITAPLFNYSGILGGGLTAAEKGATVHVGSLTGQLSLPVVDSMLGSLPKKDKDWFSTLISMASNANSIRTRSSGINPSSVSNVEANVFNEANLDPKHQTATQMYYETLLQREELMMQREMHEAASRIYSGQDKSWKLDPNSTTQWFDIQNSAPIAAIAQKHLEQMNKIRARQQSAIFGGK
jgi:hypothetical protein